MPTLSCLSKLAGIYESILWRRYRLSMALRNKSKGAEGIRLLAIKLTKPESKKEGVITINIGAVRAAAVK